MKKINIQCYDNGRATLKTKDIHIESENIASVIEVDFSQVEYKDYQKGVDIQSGSYLLRYFLGNDEVVFKELTYENTLPGELVITPFVFDEVNDRKVRYLTDNSVIINKRESIASQDVPDNFDVILEDIKEFLEGETVGKLDAHIEDLNNPHGVTAEQVDTYVKTTIDNKDANTLQEAKDYTYSKVEIDDKDTAIMNKANDLENANMLKDVSYNNVNGILTFTKYDDTTKQIDLPLELIVTSGYYDKVTNELVLVLANGSEIRIPVDDLLTDLDAHNVRFNGSGTNYLVSKTDVESAVKELDTRVKTNADNVALKVNTNDIVNDLGSTDTDKPLSANQGKVLNDTTAKLAVSNVFTQPQQVPNATLPQHTTNLSQVETMFEMFKRELRGYNHAMPDLTGKEHLGDGWYELNSKTKYNALTGYFTINGSGSIPRFPFIFQELGGIYTISYEYISGDLSGDRIGVRDYGNNEYMLPIYTYNHKEKLTNIYSNTGIDIGFFANNGSVYDNLTFKLQIEKGSIATPYQVPGQIPQYKIVGEE